MEPDELAEQYVDAVMASNNKDRIRFLIADAIRRSIAFDRLVVVPAPGVRGIDEAPLPNGIGLSDLENFPGSGSLCPGLPDRVPCGRHQALLPDGRLACCLGHVQRLDPAAQRLAVVDALNQKDRAFTALAKAHADAKEAIKGCEATATCLVAERRQAHEALEECRKVLRRICTDSDHDMWASVFRSGMFSDAESALSLADAVLGT